MEDAEEGAELVFRAVEVLGGEGLEQMEELRDLALWSWERGNVARARVLARQLGEWLADSCGEDAARKLAEDLKRQLPPELFRGLLDSLPSKPVWRPSWTKSGR